MDNDKTRILIVDDEPDIGSILRLNLEMEGYEVAWAEGPLALEDPLPDLIVLDVMMTPKSGFEWAAELKADPRTARIPIIFCTAKTLEEDVLEGFAIGSDDYICKPFRIKEVKARVRAVLARAGTGASGPGAAKRTLRHEGLVLDLDSKECTVDGVAVQFTRLEFEVLALLMGHRGEVFSREKILSTVWADYVVTDRTVDVNITRIRKKIGPYSACLRSRFGYGYIFREP